MEMLTPESKYPFLVFDNVIPQDDMPFVQNELSYLSRFINSDIEGSKTASRNGIPLKQNSGLWMTSFYKDLSFSPILSGMMRIFSDDVISAISQYDNAFIFYDYHARRNTGDVLLSRYDESDYYDTHRDGSIYTAVLWLHSEPKTFEGGEFYFMFDGERVDVESKSNRLVLFPSVYEHGVTPISYNQQSMPRYSVSAFICAD
mgnify:CR=1 FL=1